MLNKIMSYDNVNDVVDGLFKSLRSRYQHDLETSITGSDFIFNSVQFLYYKCHKVNFGRGGSYIYSPEQITQKKAKINPKNKDDKCFRYAVTVALSYREIESNPERVSKIKQFINKYDWKGINYPSKIDDWETLEKNNPAIALNILYIKEKEICPAYISKYQTNNYLNEPKQRKRRLALFCSKKITCIIPWDNFKA